MSQTATPQTGTQQNARTVAATLVCVLALIGGMSVITGRAPVQLHGDQVQQITEVRPAKAKTAGKG